MDLTTQTVLDIQLVQCNEVKGSTHMELEGMKRGLSSLKEDNVIINSLVTDRHCMVKKYMKEEKKEISHYFDVWHVAKGVSKKLEACAKKKDAVGIRPWVKSITSHMYWAASTSGNDGELKRFKWDSVIQHVANIHTACAHGPLAEREWLIEESRPYRLVKSVVTSPHLRRDIGKLSAVHQTYGLEVYHNIVNHYAPKSTHFFYKSMLGSVLIRLHQTDILLLLKCLHFNENSCRSQSCTAEGTLQWNISYPKAKKGTEAVVKPMKVKPTFAYVELLLHNVVERRIDLPTYAEAEEAQTVLSYPPPTTSAFQSYNKSELNTKHKSRFSKKSCI